MNRRRFLEITGLTGGALCLSPSSAPLAGESSAPGPQGPFSFVLLGDMHFARPAHYEPGEMNDYARRVCDLTAAAWDSLWDEVAVQLREVEPRPAFVVQVGDYVHGDCPTAEKSLEHYDDFVRSIRRHALPVPLFLTRGNHEVQGRGWNRRYIEPHPSKESTYPGLRSGSPLLFSPPAFACCVRGALHWRGRVELHVGRALMAAVPHQGRLSTPKVTQADLGGNRVPCGRSR